MSILNRNGESADKAAAYKELRDSYEQRFAILLKELNDALRETPVATPPIKEIIAQLDRRWQADCEQGKRQGLEMKTDAFQKRADELLLQLERLQLYGGPITPEALELFGFRKWADGTWRTKEITVNQIGNDWRIGIMHQPIGKHSMPFLISLMKAIGLQTLTPWNEEQNG